MDKAAIIAEPKSLVIPGRGEIEYTQRADYKSASKAVKQYDERLVLGQHQVSGEWVIFVEKGPLDGAPFPVLGLGRELPHADEITKRLFQSDTRRHGDTILREMNRRNEDRRKALDKPADDATGILAEGVESFLHAQGKTRYHRSLRKQDAKHRFGRT